MSQEPILFYEEEFYPFSNFSSFQVEWRGAVWMTSEHAYQATKFDGKELAEKIKNAKSAHQAYKLAKANKNKVKSDWKDIKISVMEDIVRAKLSQHPYIQKKLIETENKKIIENSPKDSFWGRGPDWKGKNHLGKIWMKLRDELKNQ